MLRLILSNLISNAIKYTDKGVLHLGARIDNGLVITVRDTGRGIDPLDAERIFEPFEHGERIENKSTPGVGLGLALVRDLAAALGGRVALSSEKGVGSIFTVTLPLPETRVSGGRASVGARRRGGVDRHDHDPARIAAAPGRRDRSPALRCRSPAPAPAPPRRAPRRCRGGDCPARRPPRCARARSSAPPPGARAACGPPLHRSHPRVSRRGWAAALGGASSASLVDPRASTGCPAARSTDAPCPWLPSRARRLDARARRLGVRRRRLDARELLAMCARAASCRACHSCISSCTSRLSTIGCRGCSENGSRQYQTRSPSALLRRASAAACAIRRWILAALRGSSCAAASASRRRSPASCSSDARRRACATGGGVVVGSRLAPALARRRARARGVGGVRARRRSSARPRARRREARARPASGRARRPCGAHRGRRPASSPPSMQLTITVRVVIDRPLPLHIASRTGLGVGG